MSVNLGMNRKISIIFIILICSGLWFFSASAQELKTDPGVEETEFAVKINSFDHLLNIGIAAPLTALSLTGATFLTRTSKSEGEDPTSEKLIHEAKKSLIRAFVLFLACTIAIFVFDFLELLLATSPVVLELVDLVVSYSLLFAGFGNLSVAAKKMYLTQGK